MYICSTRHKIFNPFNYFYCFLVRLLPHRIYDYVASRSIQAGNLRNTILQFYDIENWPVGMILK